MELELEHIGYRYGDALASEMQALSDISLKITGGEFIGVIGHTGSGKSTLMQIMNALERPGEGRVLADGEDVWGDIMTAGRSEAVSALSFNIRNTSYLRRR